MPSIIYYGKGGKGWPGDFPHNQDDDLGFYMLPAILYPDGEIYLTGQIIQCRVTAILRRPQIKQKDLHFFK